MNVNETTVIITGGASGIGAGTARLLSQFGAKVAIFDVDMEAGKSLAEQINGLAVKCNVANELEVEKGLEEVKKSLGPPNVLVNCAGIAPAKRIVGKDGVMSLADFKKVIDINLIGTFNMLRLTAALMSTQPMQGEDGERGVIINIASIAAFEGQVGQSAYSASKGGVCALTLPAARELARFHIRVMTIAPGLIETPLVKDFPPDIQEALAAQIPYPPRFGSTLEFAHLAMHIIENRYLNGEVIRLDGALRMSA
jgi:NAD(P)-dependent dehydrogenase (short-subunit alcohol dehydrogenase family)